MSIPQEDMSLTGTSHTSRPAKSPSSPFRRIAPNSLRARPQRIRRRAPARYLPL